MYEVPGQTFIRCRLAKVRRYPGRSAILVYRSDWVPEPWAKVGHVIELRCPPDLWLNGWEVRDVYERAQQLHDVARSEPSPRQAAARRRLAG